MKQEEKDVNLIINPAQPDETTVEETPAPALQQEDEAVPAQEDDDSEQSEQPQPTIEDIIVHRHLKCRTKDTTHGLDGTVPSAIFLQFNKEQLCVRGLDHTNLFLSERLIQQNVPHEIVVHLRTRLQTHLLSSE